MGTKKEYNKTRQSGKKHEDYFIGKVKTKENKMISDYGSIWIEYYNKHVYDGGKWYLSEFALSDEVLLENGNNVMSIIITKAQYYTYLVQNKAKLKYNKAGTSLGLTVSIAEAKAFGMLVVKYADDFTNARNYTRVVCNGMKNEQLL